jgi:hypothetical protein
VKCPDGAGSDERGTKASEEDGGYQQAAEPWTTDFHEPCAGGEQCDIENRKVKQTIVVQLNLEPIFFDRYFVELKKLVGRRRRLHAYFLRWLRSSVEVKQMDERWGESPRIFFDSRTHLRKGHKLNPGDVR